MNVRREGRELAFRAAYQADVTGEAPHRCLQEILGGGGEGEGEEDREDEGPEGNSRGGRAESSGGEARAFATVLVAELEQHRDAVDAIVSKTATNWPLRRMAATDRSVLRLAVVELLHHAETPTRVALDEAIEIAKKYGSETSGAFVNGILDRIAHEARPSAG